MLPEDLYPWLTLRLGLMVLGVGASVLRSARPRGAPTSARTTTRTATTTAQHGHDHAPPATLSGRSLLAIGASAGIIPCPSALVVLLAAVAQHQIALGLLLIVAFSLGLAATLTALGVLVVRASRLLGRAAAAARGSPSCCPRSRRWPSSSSASCSRSMPPGT